MASLQGSYGATHMRAREPVRDRLVVRSSGRVYFVRTADIDWCEAAGNYVSLHVIAVPILFHLRRPHFASGPGIERHDVRVEGPHGEAERDDRPGLSG